MCPQQCAAQNLTSIYIFTYIFIYLYYLNIFIFILRIFISIYKYLLGNAYCPQLPAQPLSYFITDLIAPYVLNYSKGV